MQPHKPKPMAHHLPLIPTLEDAIRHKKYTPLKVRPHLKDTKSIKGSFLTGSQYHFSMETQTCVCIPSEHGIDVHTSTQYMDFVQIAVAECLNIPEHNVNIEVKRMGGAYGCKLSRSALAACASAIACHLTNRPVRFVMTIESNMNVIGKRYALYNEYDAEFDENGKISKLTAHYVQDYGCSLNDSVQSYTDDGISNVYNASTWSVRGETIITDAPSQTYCRGPGTMEAIALTENIMEHIAWSLGIDAVSVRLANTPDDSLIKQMMPVFLKQSGKYISFFFFSFGLINRFSFLFFFLLHLRLL